ncbi:MAG TPA: hypothetical protein VMV46_23585 [Thermoanaerobaculia bacterium]|nr:hypothetical protein [Thermoanaerobaculia bacterium]
MRRLALVVLLGLGAGCGGEGAERAGRGIGAGLWASAGVTGAELSASETLDALRRAGVDTLFVDAGALGADGRLTPGPIAAGLGDLGVVPVVRLPWARLEALSRREAARLAEELVLLAVEWEGGGVSLRGIHLRPDGEPEDRDAAAAALRWLNRELPARYPLSLHLDAARLDDLEPLDALAAAVDRLVGEVYGQAAGERDEPSRWELEPALERARRLDALRRPFLATVALGGRVVDPATGEAVARGLPAEVWAAEAARVEGHFAFAGFHRQQLELTPSRPLPGDGIAGDSVTLAAGARIRLARPTARHLAALGERLAAAGLARLEGILWTEARPPGDVAAVPVDRLPAVLEDGAGSDLRIELERLAGSDGLRVRVLNRGDPTAWAERTHNYVEVELDGAVFGPVELGGFARMELGRRDGSGQRNAMETLRSANRLRLFFVQLDPGGSAASGAIGVRAARGDWDATASAGTLETTGEIVEVVPSRGAPASDAPSRTSPAR